MQKRAFVVLLLLCLTACNNLRFQEPRVVRTDYDPGLEATRVTLEFQVLDSTGLPVSDLKPESFTVHENGVPLGPEAMARMDTVMHPIDVVLLLDRSASMFRTGTIRELKNVTFRISSALAEHPAHMLMYGFARTVTPLASTTELPDKADDDTEHWTSLYHAVQNVLNRHPKGIVVILTDGADNYSHNLGGPRLTDLAKQIRDEKRIVHAIGFGDIEKEFDRTGVSARKALRSLTTLGSYNLAVDPQNKRTMEQTVDEVVADVIRRIPATYTYQFLSPSLHGERTVQINTKGKKQRGRSEKIVFVGAGPKVESRPVGSQPAVEKR